MLARTRTSFARIKTATDVRQDDDGRLQGKNTTPLPVRSPAVETSGLPETDAASSTRR